MATRTALKIKEALMQYSKKMCTRVTIFWMLYRFANFVVVLINPGLANALVDLSAGIDTIMITNMSTYLLNSSTEKIAVAFGKRKTMYPEDSNDNEKDDEEEDEGEDNG